jgi:enterochelin esterase-like enzyme
MKNLNYTRMKKSLLLSFFFWCFIITIETTGQPRPVITSPEFNTDGTVTFRYFGPKAQKVEISGEFLKENKVLTKTDTAVWSITLPAVEPDIYPYFFIVDGVSLADPSNPNIFPNERFKRSLLDAPSRTPLLHDLQDVPHGTVSSRYYTSKSLNMIRPLLVYTPPGYENNSASKYPVLYLIHGMTDTEETWTKVGRINLILDNLIAQGKANPMIVVMPYANPYPDLLKKDKTTKVDLLRTDMFIREIIEEVIPYTEKNFRVVTEASNRAIAGFSLGGRQALAAGLSKPEKFAWVFAYAPAIWKREFDETFKNLYAPADQLNNHLRVLWISCGRSDFLYQSTTDFLATLDEKKIRYTPLFTEGGHTWMNVRDYLAATAQLLFK